MKIAQLARLAAPALVVAGLIAAAPASAQTAARPATIGVVDTDQVLQNSLAGKAVKLEQEKYATQYTSQSKDTETKLRAEDQELAQQRSVLAPDVFQQRATAFQQKLQDYQNQMRDKQERLEVATNQAVNEIVNTMYVVAQELAKERGLTAVMARQPLLWFDPTTDVTKAVLDKLNARLPTVAFQNPDTLQRPEAPGAAAGAGAKPAAGAPAPAAPAAKKK